MCEYQQIFFCSPDICGTGECKNVNGDFVCECEGGYTNGPTKKCIGKFICLVQLL